MKLYMHPASTASRPVRLLIAENKLPIEEQVVDLMTGEHHKEPYASKNPNRLVPMLEDGDFRLTESVAIMKFLCGKFELPLYPKDLKKRAKVDEAMDWFNTQFYRDFGYNLAYPQLFAHHKRPTDEINKGTVAWGRGKAQHWLTLLNDHWLGDKPFLCGNEMTIADYFGACIVTLGDLIRCDLKKFPKVEAWVERMRKLPTWDKVNEVHHGFAKAVKDQPFEAI